MFTDNLIITKKTGYKKALNHKFKAKNARIFKRELKILEPHVFKRENSQFYFKPANGLIVSYYYCNNLKYML